jgi:hypothetical protein
MNSRITDQFVIDAFRKAFFRRRPQLGLIAHSDHGSQYCNCCYKIENLLVPFIPKPKQEEIAELVKQSFVLCKKAKQFLDEVTKKVEAAIA